MSEGTRRMRAICARTGRELRRVAGPARAMKRFPGATVPSENWFPDVGRFFPRYSLTITIPAKPQACFKYMNPAANGSEDRPSPRGREPKEAGVARRAAGKAARAWTAQDGAMCSFGHPRPGNLSARAWRGFRTFSSHPEPPKPLRRARAPDAMPVQITNSPAIRRHSPAG